MKWIFLRRFLCFLFLSFSFETLASGGAHPAPSAELPPYDFHFHLGGSVSVEFLRKKLGEDFPEDFKTFDIDKKFGLVHKALSSPESITEAVVDVAKTHPAWHLEIRSTPRVFEGEESFEPYVKAFCEGVQKARLVTGKSVYALLSVDRYTHNLEAALGILELAKRYPEVVGVDVSGFRPGSPRRLKGPGLGSFIAKVYKEEGLGLGLHLGEFNDLEERADTAMALGVLEHLLSSGGSVAGKIRLGHAIYLTEDQKKLIHRLGIPIEVCPSCHRQVITCQESGPWHAEGSEHPVRQVYDGSEPAPVFFGVDDSFVFAVDQYGLEYEAFIKLFPSRFDWKPYAFGTPVQGKFSFFQETKEDRDFFSQVGIRSMTEEKIRTYLEHLESQLGETWFEADVSLGEKGVVFEPVELGIYTDREGRARVFREGLEALPAQCVTDVKMLYLSLPSVKERLRAEESLKAIDCYKGGVSVVIRLIAREISELPEGLRAFSLEEILVDCSEELATQTRLTQEGQVKAREARRRSIAKIVDNYVSLEMAEEFHFLKPFFPFNSETGEFFTEELESYFFMRRIVRDIPGDQEELHSADR